MSTGKTLWCQICGNYSIPYSDNKEWECYMCKIERLQKELRETRQNLEHRGKTITKYRDRAEQAERQLSECKNALETGDKAIARNKDLERQLEAQRPVMEAVRQHELFKICGDGCEVCKAIRHLDGEP